MVEEVNEERRQEFQAFIEHLQAHDMLGVVVVGALYIEQELQKLCRAHLTEPSAIDRAELKFDQWVHLSIAFGLTEKLRAPLKAFAEVRNKFAHRLGFEITDQTIKNLYKSFNGEHRAKMDASITRTNKKLGIEGKKNFHEFDDKMRVLMIVTTLRGALVTANWQAAKVLERSSQEE